MHRCVKIIFFKNECEWKWFKNKKEEEILHIEINNESSSQIICEYERELGDIENDFVGAIDMFI